MNLFSETILTSAWSPIVWKDNNALTTNFEFSDFLVLDFDTPGDQTMDEVNHSLQDHRRIIATTRNHGRLKQGVTCDRYRLIIPWAKRITCYKTYRQNYGRVLEKYTWADRSCLDGARFFFPSQKIIYIDRDSEYSWDVSEYVEPEIKPEVKIKNTRLIPSWCLNFINYGLVSCESRNQKVFSVAWELFDQGFTEIEVRIFILKAPINFIGVNIEAAIKSAKKRSERG